MLGEESVIPLTIDDLKAKATVSVRELAPLLGCSSDALYESIAAGTCPWRVLRIGRRILLPTAPIVRDLLGGEPQPEGLGLSVTDESAEPLGFEGGGHVAG